MEHNRQQLSKNNGNQKFGTHPLQLTSGCCSVRYRAISNQEVKHPRRCFSLHLRGKNHLLFIIGVLERKLGNKAVQASRMKGER